MSIRKLGGDFDTQQTAGDWWTRRGLPADTSRQLRSTAAHHVEHERAAGGGGHVHRHRHLAPAKVPLHRPLHHARYWISAHVNFARQFGTPAYPTQSETRRRTAP